MRSNVLALTPVVGITAFQSQAQRKPKTRRRKPSHDEIAVRAYFLHLEVPGSDQLGNWLRAERELTPA